MRRAAIATASAMALAACRGGEPPAPPPTPAPRVVSLSPAITRTLVDLGAAEHLVGRTPFCRSVPAEIPAVGSLLEIDFEALLSAAPDLVLVQPPAGGLDPALALTAEERGFRIETFPIDGLGDLAALLEGLPEALAVGAEPAAAAAWRERAAALRSRLDDACRPLAAPPAGPVAVLFSLEPPMAFGEGTFVGEFLDRLGVANAVRSRGYPELSLEDLVRLDPDLLVLLREQAASPETLGRIAGLPAAAAGRVRQVEHPEALVPGSGWIGAAESLRRAIAEGSPR